MLSIVATRRRADSRSGASVPKARHAPFGLVRMCAGVGKGIAVLVEPAQFRLLPCCAFGDPGSKDPGLIWNDLLSSEYLFGRRSL